MEKRTTVRLPRDLLSGAKRKAVAEGRTLTSVIADGLRMVLADDHSSTRATRILPLVSKAGGGLVSGIAADSRAFQENDDIAYMLRSTRPR
jgi:hypothetical protein